MSFGPEKYFLMVLTYSFSSYDRALTCVCGWTVNSGHTDFWRFLQRFESIVSVCKAVPPEGLKITGMNIEFQLFPVILHCGKLFCKRRHVFFFLFFLQIGERMQIFTHEKLCLSKLLFHTQSCYWTVASWPNKMQNVPPVVLKRFFL